MASRTIACASGRTAGGAAASPFESCAPCRRASTREARRSPSRAPRQAAHRARSPWPGRPRPRRSGGRPRRSPEVHPDRVVDPDHVRGERLELLGGELLALLRVERAGVSAASARGLVPSSSTTSTPLTTASAGAVGTSRSAWSSVSAAGTATALGTRGTTAGWPGAGELDLGERPALRPSNCLVIPCLRDNSRADRRPSLYAHQGFAQGLGRDSETPPPSAPRWLKMMWVSGPPRGLGRHLAGVSRARRLGLTGHSCRRVGLRRDAPGRSR